MPHGFLLVFEFSWRRITYIKLTSISNCIRELWGSIWLVLCEYECINPFTLRAAKRGLTIVGNIFLTKASFWKHLKEKCWSEDKQQLSMKYFIDTLHLKYPMVNFGSEGSALTRPLFLLSPWIIMLCHYSSTLTKDQFCGNILCTKWPLCVNVPLFIHSFIHVNLIIFQGVAEVVGPVHGEYGRDGDSSAVLRGRTGLPLASQSLLLLWKPREGQYTVEIVQVE